MKMRCSKARELYFKNCDGLLNEAEKMRLQEHLDCCPACLSMASEMNHCRELLRGLPEVTPSENFEWNLKRRILEEKSKGFRRHTEPFILRPAWGRRFVAGAAATIVVTLAGTWTVMRVGGSTDQPIGRRAESVSRQANVTQNVSERVGTPVYLPTADYYPTGLRLVSSNRAGERSMGEAKLLPLQSVTETRENSLRRENEYLKRRIADLERENLQLRRLLLQQRSRR
jgi:predicted anti-sigma-YlaC factor YlaD